jgi:hypothetical protein
VKHVTSLILIPAWVLQDALIILVAVIVTAYIIKKEEHPVQILLELLCFTLLYAAIFENFATLMGWYNYGKSLIMVGNVIITVPVIEYLVVYTTLRLLRTMQIPTWCKPFIVGFSGMLFDFSLDPVSVRLIYSTLEGTIGRWTWYIGANDVNIYNVPVYNFLGWVLLCGYGAAFILLGRWWFTKSNYSKKVGYTYPILAMLGALVTLMSPLSNFLLWAEPFFIKGSVGEWLMLTVHFILPLTILAVFWRGRMKQRLSLKDDYPIFLVLILFHISDIIVAVVFGFVEILWLQLLFTAIQTSLILLVYYRGTTLPAYS